jgi:hypothetical protein
MVKGTAEFTKQNTDRAIQATSVGLDWMRDMVEQTLGQSHAAVGGWLTVTRKATEGLDQQAATWRDHSLALAERTFSNSFELGYKIARAKEPQELMQAQCDFVSQQSEMIAEQTKGIAKSVAHGATELTDTMVRQTRKRPEAA